MDENGLGEDQVPVRKTISSCLIFTLAALIRKEDYLKIISDKKTTTKTFEMYATLLLKECARSK